MTNIFSAQELRREIAIAEGEKASAAFKLHQQAEAEKKALLEKMSKPSGLSDDEIIEKTAVIVNRAVENGLTSVQVYRFPHTLCSDNGRGRFGAFSLSLHPGKTRLIESGRHAAAGSGADLSGAPMARHRHTREARPAVVNS